MGNCFPRDGWIELDIFRKFLPFPLGIQDLHVRTMAKLMCRPRNVKKLAEPRQSTKPNRIDTSDDQAVAELPPKSVGIGVENVKN